MVADYIEMDETPDSINRLKALPEHWRYLLPLLCYYNEVNNGGHHQYLWNSQGAYRSLVAEGLKYYQADQFEKNYIEVMTLYKPGLYEVANGASWESFQETYKEDRYDRQDSLFFKISPNLAELLAKVVRENLELYQ